MTRADAPDAGVARGLVEGLVVRPEIIDVKEHEPDLM